MTDGGKDVRRNLWLALEGTVSLWGCWRRIPSEDIRVAAKEIWVSRSGPKEIGFGTKDCWREPFRVSLSYAVYPS